MEEFTLTTNDLCSITRRQFFARTGMGMGLLTLATMFGESSAAEPIDPFVPKQPHFPAKAKQVIHIFAYGGPSQVDTWDPKPALNKYEGKPIPGYSSVAYGSPFKFKKMGQSGIDVSEVFPKLGEHVDKMTVLRALWTDIPAHEPAARFLHTGAVQLPRPSIGSWVVYGLGYQNKNLPAFISLGGGRAEWRQGSFLPGMTQGVNVNYKPGMRLNEILLNIHNQFTPLDLQRTQIELARKLNTLYSQELQKDPQLEARIESFEMAFKMQTEATSAFDVSKEPKQIQDLYGPTELGQRLLVARRLVERGVRFVQVNAGGWDHHSDLQRNLPRRAQDIDGPAAALLTDLQRSGLLNETLVIWGGEIGRTVVRDLNGGAGDSAGRDHNGMAICGWMAGGGLKQGIIHGATDEFGGQGIENRVHVHDLQATILALLGFDHTKLTFRYNGRDFRLTDNFGKVVKQIIA